MDQLFTTFEFLIQMIDTQMALDGSESSQFLVELVKIANIIIQSLESHMLTSANQRKVRICSILAYSYQIQMFTDLCYICRRFQY
jgi:hypothetical protein